MSRFLLRELMEHDADNEEMLEPVGRVFRDLEDPFSGLSEDEIYRRYRFPRHIILELTELLADDLERPTQRSRALPALYQVAIGLRYLASNSFQGVVGDTVHVRQSTACRSLHRFMDALIKHLNDFIQFPVEEELDRIKDGFYQLADFPNIVGAVDGTHVRMIPPATDKEVYRNHKQYLSINVQAVCDHKGEFRHVYADWPGSKHDSFVYRSSIVPSLMDALPGDNWLLGDKAYPCTPTLLTPYRDVGQLRNKRNYNRAHRKTRVIIEQLFGRWKRRFIILHNEMRLQSPQVCSLAIICCAMLQNLASRHVLPDFDDENVQNGGDMDEQAPILVEAHGDHVRDMVVERYFS